MAWIWAANPCCKCWNAGAFRVGAPGGMRLLVAGSLAGCCTCWLLVRLLVAGVEKDKHCQHCAAPHWPLPFRHSFDHAPGSWGVHGAGQPRRERNEIQKRKDEGRKLEAHTNHNVNDERPRPPSKEPIGILYIILFRFAFSRAVSGLQATEGLSRGSLALGEPEAEATNGTADGPGTQRLPPLTPLVRIQITEAAHNAEGTSQRAHGSPCTPARTLRGNARTTHANWIFFRIQHADDA